MRFRDLTWTCRRCGDETHHPYLHALKHLVYNKTVQPFCDWMFEERPKEELTDQQIVNAAAQYHEANKGL